MDEHLGCDGRLRLDGSSTNRQGTGDFCKTVVPTGWVMEQTSVTRRRSFQSRVCTAPSPAPSRAVALSHIPPDDSGLPFHLQRDSGEAPEWSWALAVKLSSPANLLPKPCAFQVTLSPASYQETVAPRGLELVVCQEGLQSCFAGL